MDIVPGPSGEALRIGPTTTLVKIPGSATGGRLGVVEMHVPGGFDGPPPHVHGSVEHLWVVRDGAVDLLVGDRTSRAAAGDLVLVPSGVPHSFSTAASGPVVLLEVDLGRALDGYLRELRDVLGEGPVDPGAVAAVMARHDTAVVRS